MDIMVWMTFVIPTLSLVLTLVLLVAIGTVAGIKRLIEKGTEGLIITGCLTFWAGLGVLYMILP